MRAAQNARQPVYLSGGVGYGKTALVRNFMGKKRYLYYSATDLGALEEGYRRLLERDTAGQELTVVLDDLHVLDSQELRERYYPLIAQLAGRSRVWLILVSRALIPGWLKSLHIKHVFVQIGQEQLALSPQEQGQFLENWQLRPTPETLQDIHRRFEGYPLLLRICSIALSGISDRETDYTRLRQQELAVLSGAAEDLLDHLERHVFAHWDLELLDFLMELSIMGSFDLNMAQLVTKRSDAGQILQYAKEMGSFLEEHSRDGKIWYKFRKALRVSMGRRLERTCTKNHIQALYQVAAAAYELSGDTMSALSMYEKVGDQEGISRLLIQNSRKYPGNGQFWELRRYYLALPEEMVKASPELMCTMSMLQSILLNDEESERWYGELAAFASRHSSNLRKAAKARLLYLDIGLPHRGSLKMVDIFKNGGAFLAEHKTMLPELSLTNNQPSILNGGKDFCHWCHRDREMARSYGKLFELALGKFGKGIVNITLAESLFEKGEDSYEVVTLLNQGRLQAESGGKPEQVFLAAGLLAQLSLLNNRSEEALEMLQSLRCSAAKDAPQLLKGIDSLTTRILLYTGKLPQVEQWLRSAPDEDTEFCTLERYRYMAKARVYLALGRKERALSLLQRMLAYAEKRQRFYIRVEAGVLLAIVQYRMGLENWKQSLQEAVTLAEGSHFVRILTREGAALLELLKVSQLQWTDDKFRQKVLSECKHMAALYPGYLKEKEHVLLSPQAIRILQMQAEGLSIRQIADTLGLSQAGVKYYNTETYRKLNVKGKAAAINEARNRKLI